ncbi:histidine kinase [candidate division KSB1 bacterium]|nr:histidine kinase [candidate division KSB1 bacterium]
MRIAWIVCWILFTGILIAVSCSVFPEPLRLAAVLLALAGVGGGAAMIASKTCWAPRREKVMANKGSGPEKTVPISQLFLFNTLHNIQALIHFDAPRASRTLEQLADYVRAVMQVEGQEWVYLSNELKCIDLYLQIEGARFGDRLERSLKIDDDCREVMIPSCLLQPLVETALRHGVEAFEGKTRVSISVHKEKNRLAIELLDMGEGFDSQPEMCMEKRRLLYERVKDRLQNAFGSAAEFKSAAVVPIGCRVRLLLPFQPAA